MHIPRPQVHQPRAGIPLLPSEAIRLAAALAQRHAKGAEAVVRHHLTRRVGQLPHAAQPIVHVVGPRPTVVLRQEVMAVQVAGGLASSGLLQDLGQASSRIKHVGGGDTVHGLAYTVAHPIVGVGVGLATGVRGQDEAIERAACPEHVEGSRGEVEG
ncbi:MAG: hypothetical protein ACETWR_07765 [Anaerolineae bacterium]